jgi:hypothetical protein
MKPAPFIMENAAGCEGEGGYFFQITAFLA